MSGERSGWGDGRPVLGVDALLIAEREASDGALALAAVGVPVAARVGWAALAAEVPQPLIIAEAQGIAPDLLAPGLARIAEWGAAGRSHIVIAFDPDQLDEVAAALLGDQAELLCAPDQTAWVSAVAIAGHRARPGGVREGDDAVVRLRRVNEEIARIADALAGAAADAPRRAGLGASASATVSGGSSPPAAADLRRAIRARRLRDQYFGTGLFEEPAWDMLLDLYAAELEGQRVSVSSLCIAAAVAPTTALRWITRMIEAGLFARAPDPIDRRRAYMMLTPAARGGMQAYAQGLAASGIRLA